MKKILLLTIVLALTGMSSLFAVDIVVVHPIFSGTHPSVPQINAESIRIFYDIENELRAEIGGINANPQRLIGAFANSSVFSSNGATQRGYGGYNRFAFTVGPMVGFQLPSSPFNVVDEIDGILERLDVEGDINFGVNPQVLNAQFSMNTPSLLEDLYLGLKVGFMSLPIDSFSFRTFSLGLMGNYQLLNQRSLGMGSVLWRGVNVGAGLIYQNTSLGLGIPIDPIEAVIPITGHDITMVIEPDINLDFSINTFSIPIEVMTSIRLLYFMNFALGAGADIGLGNANLSAGGNANVDFGNTLPEGVNQVRAGNISIGLGGERGPSTFNPKIMCGLGFSIGPVVIDIPLTIYPMDQGYNLGLTFGFFW